MKRCTHCKKTKSLRDYYKDRSREDGYAHRCKKCHRKLMGVVRDRNGPRVHTPDPNVIEKRCPGCKQTKKLDQFHRTHTTPYRSYVVLCKKCVSDRYYRKKRQVRREYVKRVYGLTPEDLNQLLEKADHKCEICRVPFAEGARGAAIDHCHATGKIRGLLCMSCNLGLGKFKDDAQLLVSAVDYLERVG